MRLALVLALATGCSEEPEQPSLDIWPVNGTVTDKAGEAVKEGMLEFRSVTSADQSAQGDVQPDGRFSLFTLIEGNKQTGAAKGEYRVTFYPRMSASQSELPVTINETFLVEPEENNFEIRLK